MSPRTYITSLQMILSRMEMSSLCILKLPSSIVLLYLGISAMSNSVISSRNIVVVIPLVGSRWYNPIRCIGVLYAIDLSYKP